VEDARARALLAVHRGDVAPDHRVDALDKFMFDVGKVLDVHSVLLVNEVAMVV
jgi:hypothetical protein